MPETSTTMLKKRPTSLSKVMSPEAQRAHHRQRPVQAGNPRMLFLFDVHHDQVKHLGEDEHYHHDKSHILHQRPDVALDFLVAKEIRKLRADDLHGGPVLFDFGAGRPLLRRRCTRYAQPRSASTALLRPPRRRSLTDIPALLHLPHGSGLSHAPPRYNTSPRLAKLPPTDALSTNPTQTAAATDVQENGREVPSNFIRDIIDRDLEG